MTITTSRARRTITAVAITATLAACSGPTITVPSTAPAVTVTAAPPPPVTVTTTQPPPPTTAATDTPTSDTPTTTPYTYPYPVTQGTTAAELSIAGIVWDPANNLDWGANRNETRTPVDVACQLNTDLTTPQHFNCNISFTNGMGTSYWVDQQGGSYSATPRTH